MTAKPDKPPLAHLRPPAPYRAQFDIAGMHCAACANRNERALKGLPGVREATVNLALRRAHVAFDPALVSERALHEAVIANGFGC